MGLFNKLLLAVFLVRLALHFIPAPALTTPPPHCTAPPPIGVLPPPYREIPRKYDLCVYGATGFTGTLVAKYIAEHPNLPKDFTWCVAGRSSQKLDAVIAGLDVGTANLGTWRGAPPPAKLLVDATNPADLNELANAAKVVLTTVGPYTLYGKPLVAACAAAGTHYADLSGEFFFQAEAIAEFDALAAKSGAKIVVASGYDSIPFDIGADIALAALGIDGGDATLTTVSSVVTMCHGSASGGTVLSAWQGMKDMFNGIKEGTMTMAYASDPYILVPDSDFSRSSDEAHCVLVDQEATGFGSLPRFDKVFGAVSIPHFMAYVNSRVVRRSQFLLRPLARISYSESMTVASLVDAMVWSIPHWVTGEIPLIPKSGMGPGPLAQKAGGFEIRIKAANERRGSVELHGVGSGDPGYGHTSRLLAEVGLCLLDDDCRAKNGGGIKTVASAVKSREIRKRFAEAKGPDGEALLVYKSVSREEGRGAEL